MTVLLWLIHVGVYGYVLCGGQVPEEFPEGDLEHCLSFLVCGILQGLHAVTQCRRVCQINLAVHANLLEELIQLLLLLIFDVKMCP